MKYIYAVTTQGEVLDPVFTYKKNAVEHAKDLAELAHENAENRGMQPVIVKTKNGYEVWNFEDTLNTFNVIKLTVV